MSVRLKFKVSAVSRRIDYNQRTVGEITLNPVSGGSDENKAFYAASPSGEFKFGTVNEAALAALPLGAECYIDITIAPAAAAA
jgi:hypothetical protein